MGSEKNLYQDQIQRIKNTANSFTEPIIQAGAIDALKEYGKQSIDDQVKKHGLKTIEDIKKKNTN